MNNNNILMKMTNEYYLDVAFKSHAVSSPLHKSSAKTVCTVQNNLVKNEITKTHYKKIFYCKKKSVI